MATPLTDYQIAAALAVARRVDPAGNDQATIDSALRTAATEGLWPYEQLQRGQALLIDAKLLVPTPPTSIAQPANTPQPTGLALSGATAVAAALDDQHALYALRRLIEAALDPQDNAQQRIEIGDRAEEHVVQACRNDLRSLGRPDLAEQVQRVSLISDHFGYDITAPTVAEPTRHFEVKGSTRTDRAIYRFFISRNEYDVGRKQPSTWFLIACDVPTANPTGLPATVAIVGHCTAATLDPYLPQDANGRWTEAAVALPRYLLTAGLPTAIP